MRAPEIVPEMLLTTQAMVDIFKYLTLGANVYATHHNPLSPAAPASDTGSVTTQAGLFALEVGMDSNQDNWRVEAFTPGPWRYSRLNWRNEVDDHKRFVSGENERGFYVGVCVVEGNRTSQCVTEANARLIAASPSMHAVLSRLVAMCDAGYDMRDGDGAMHEVSIPLINDARALLAKIGGAQ